MFRERQLRFDFISENYMVDLVKMKYFDIDDNIYKATGDL